MSRIFITGDTHRSFQRLFNFQNFDQNDLTRDDYLIICGDFGGIWDGGGGDKKVIESLGRLKYTILFVDGNHSNFNALYKYPVEEWHGGYVHRISDNILHLCRGQVFDIDGKKFFTFGGAASHDISDGILDPDDPDFRKKYIKLYHNPMAMFRILGVSWWPEEMPNNKEYNIGISNLEKVDYKVDYIISHCPPSSALAYFGNGTYKTDELSDYLEKIFQKVQPKAFYCGHIHIDENYDKIHVLYYDIQEIV